MDNNSKIDENDLSWISIDVIYDLNKLEQISNCTGGGIYHYNFNQKTILNDIYQNSLNNYYDKR